MVKEKSIPSGSNSEMTESVKDLVLFNDHVNSFDFVIRSLIEVCEHENEQAEQCAWIAHLKGKCAVKTGSFEELKPQNEELSRRGLTVDIE